MVETPGKLTLWAIEVFLATAEEGAVSAAARRLGASPSAISQQLSNLETALGVTLLDRSARPVRLTPAGELFRLRAQTILTEADQAKAELVGSGATRLSTLRLGAIEDADADIIPNVLTALAARLTQCRFLLEIAPSHQLYDLLEARALDMAMAAVLPPVPPWMQAVPLLADPFVILGPVGVAPEDLRDLPFIQYTTRHVMGRQIAAHMLDNGLSPVTRFELGSYPAILAMVAEARGWTILSAMATVRAQRFLDRVTVLPLSGRPLQRQIALCSRVNSGLGDWVGQTAELMRAQFDRHSVQPALARWPWLEGQMRLL